MTTTAARLATGIWLVFFLGCSPSDSEADLKADLARAQAKLDAIRSELDAVSQGGAYLVVDRLGQTLQLKMKGTTLISSPAGFTDPGRTRQVCGNAAVISVPESGETSASPPDRYAIRIRCAAGAEFEVGIRADDPGLFSRISRLLTRRPDGGTLEIPALDAMRLYPNLTEGMRIIFVEDAEG